MLVAHIGRGDRLDRDLHLDAFDVPSLAVTVVDGRERVGTNFLGDECIVFSDEVVDAVVSHRQIQPDPLFEVQLQILAHLLDAADDLACVPLALDVLGQRGVDVAVGLILAAMLRVE